VLNPAFLFDLNGTAAERSLQCAIERDWFWKHEPGTSVKLTQAGAELFA
jgi:hypothetical protein